MRKKTSLFFILFLSFSFSLQKLRSHATLMRMKDFSGRIRCVVICHRLIEKHTQCVICNPVFCEKMKINVVALPFFGLGIAQAVSSMTECKLRRVRRYFGVNSKFYILLWWQALISSGLNVMYRSSHDITYRNNQCRRAISFRYYVIARNVNMVIRIIKALQNDCGQIYLIFYAKLFYPFFFLFFSLPSELNRLKFKVLAFNDGNRG